MRKMKTSSFIAAICLAAAVSLTGCVSKKKYVALQSEYDALSAKYQDAQLALTESRTGSQGLEALLEEARRNNEDLKKRYASLQRNLEKSLTRMSRAV